jgi:hypothetical protein
MPFELELVVVDDDDPELVVAWLAGVVAEPDELELEPQAATPSAAKTSRAAASRLGDRVVVFVIGSLSCRVSEGPAVP